MLWSFTKTALPYLNGVIMSPVNSPYRRRRVGCGAVCLFALSMAAGCASTKETEREDLATGNLLQPNQIWVYNFAAMPAEVAAQSALAGQGTQGAAPLTAQQIADGRKLGSEIATELIQQIHAMGLPATNASATS